MEDVKRQTEIKIEQHQREFYLRQQLRAIQTELGETDPGEKETIDTLKKIGNMAPQSRKEMGKLQARLVAAGYRSHEAVTVFFGIRLSFL